VFEGMCCYLQGDMAAAADVAARLLQQQEQQQQQQERPEAPSPAPSTLASRPGSRAPSRAPSPLPPPVGSDGGTDESVLRPPTYAAVATTPTTLAKAMTGVGTDRDMAAWASQRLWTHLLALLPAVHAEDVDPALPMAEEARALLVQTVNDEAHWSELVSLQQMLWHAVHAKLLARQGHMEAAATAAKEALQRLSFLAGNPLFAVTYMVLALCADALLAAAATAPATDEDARLLDLVLQGVVGRFARFARCALAHTPPHTDNGALTCTCRHLLFGCLGHTRLRRHGQSWCAARTCASGAAPRADCRHCGSRGRVR
jgi:hypothetical protein